MFVVLKHVPEMILWTLEKIAEMISEVTVELPD